MDGGHMYASPEGGYEKDLGPLPKSPKFNRKTYDEQDTDSIQPSIQPQSLTTELASHKMLLHDATQAMHLNSVNRKK